MQFLKFLKCLLVRIFGKLVVASCCPLHQFVPIVSVNLAFFRQLSGKKLFCLLNERYLHENQFQEIVSTESSKAKLSFPGIQDE